MVASNVKLVIQLGLKFWCSGKGGGGGDPDLLNLQRRTEICWFKNSGSLRYIGD